MKYVHPLKEAVNSKYSNGNPETNTPGSIIPAQAIEHPQREIVNVISESGLTPNADDNEQLYQAIRKLCAPAGQIMMWGGASGASVPKGFLYCNGQAVSRTKYADLFAVIGTTHGAGNGANTFNVPNMRGRFALGADNDKPAGDDGGSFAKTLNTGNSTVNISGKTQGHQLSEAEMPRHQHFIANSGQQTDSTVYLMDNNTLVRFRNTGGSGYFLLGSDRAANIGKSSEKGSNQAHDHDVNITGTGSHNHAITNMDVTNPYYTLIYMIRT
ncbi:MAG: phage tail protein [Alphaproteobacteria bacterium]|nr:phage tail protein [Alphaproteobacteria bacterium]